MMEKSVRELRKDLDKLGSKVSDEKIKYNSYQFDKELKECVNQHNEILEHAKRTTKNDSSVQSLNPTKFDPLVNCTWNQTKKAKLISEMKLNSETISEYSEKV